MDSNKYEILTAAYLSGNLSKDEEKDLLAWVEADPVNESMFFEMKKVWEITDDYQPDFAANPEPAWGKLENTLFQDADESKKAGVLPKRLGWLRVAAVIFALVGLSLWLLNPVLNPPKNLLSFETLSGETRQLALPDGSQVWLNENSQLQYPEKFKARTVHLEGEAYFQVERDEKHPFEIYSGRTKTVVLGTTFNVRAYPEETTIEVTVESGRVSFEEKTGQDPIFLKRGEQGVFEKEKTGLYKRDKESDNLASWKNRLLDFEDTPLEGVLRDLERYFKVIFEVRSGEKLLKCSWSGTYKEPELGEILEILKIGLNLEIEFDGEKYIVTGEGCENQ